MSASRASLRFPTSLPGVMAFSFECQDPYPIRPGIELSALPGNVAPVFRSPCRSWNEQDSRRKQIETETVAGPLPASDSAGLGRLAGSRSYRGPLVAGAGGRRRSGPRRRRQQPDFHAGQGNAIAPPQDWPGDGAGHFPTSAIHYALLGSLREAVTVAGDNVYAVKYARLPGPCCCPHSPGREIPKPCLTRGFARVSGAA